MISAEIFNVRWCNFWEQRNIWRCQHIEVRIQIFCKQIEGPRKIMYIRHLVPTKDTTRLRDHSGLCCPMCFCRDFNPAKAAVTLHDLAERRQRVQSRLQWAYLICSLFVAAYIAVVEQLCTQFFPGLALLGTGQSTVERKHFSWASIKSLCFELPTNTSGLCGAYHFDRQKRAELCTLNMYRYALNVDQNSTSAAKVQLGVLHRKSKFNGPSVLCLHMHYAWGCSQCFVKSVLQTLETMDFYKNMCRVNL